MRATFPKTHSASVSIRVHLPEIFRFSFPATSTPFRLWFNFPFQQRTPRERWCRTGSNVGLWPACVGSVSPTRGSMNFCGARRPQHTQPGRTVLLRRFSHSHSLSGKQFYLSVALRAKGPSTSQPRASEKRAPPWVKNQNKYQAPTGRDNSSHAQSQTYRSSISTPCFRQSARYSS